MSYSSAAWQRANLPKWRVLREGRNRPYPVCWADSEAEARRIVRDLNRCAAPGRPLYWCELYETSSVLDTEHARS
jgi:hypothetical protein